MTKAAPDRARAEFSISGLNNFSALCGTRGVEEATAHVLLSFRLFGEELFFTCNLKPHPSAEDAVRRQPRSSKLLLHRVLLPPPEQTPASSSSTAPPPSGFAVYTPRVTRPSSWTLRGEGLESSHSLSRSLWTPAQPVQSHRILSWLEGALRRDSPSLPKAGRIEKASGNSTHTRERPSAHLAQPTGPIPAPLPLPLHVPPF